MLVVKIEVHPGGDSDRAYEIARAEVGNVSNLADVSDYDWRALNGDGVVTHRGRIRGHRRADGAWALVGRLVELLGMGAGEVQR